MVDRDRCAICRQRPRIVDSIMCASCGFGTIEASSRHQKRQDYRDHAPFDYYYEAAAGGR